MAGESRSSFASVSRCAPPNDGRRRPRPVLGPASHGAEGQALEANEQRQGRGNENHGQRCPGANVAAIREPEDRDRQRHPAWRIDHDRRTEFSHRKGEAQKSHLETVAEPGGELGDRVARFDARLMRAIKRAGESVEPADPCRRSSVHAARPDGIRRPCPFAGRPRSLRAPRRGARS